MDSSVCFFLGYFFLLRLGQKNADYEAINKNIFLLGPLGVTKQCGRKKYKFSPSSLTFFGFDMTRIPLSLSLQKEKENGAKEGIQNQ